jgi:iron complex outermembrane receptor protein
MNATSFLVGTLAAASLATGACAQDLHAPQDEVSEDSLVPVLTPSRLRQSLRDIPVSVTILSADTLSTYGFLGIDEAVRMVAGTGPNRLAWAQYNLAVGNKSSTGPARVLLLIDGVEVGGSPFMNADDWGDLPVGIDDVDRIEVLRGPYASGSGHALTTAVVNIVTKHPEDVERVYARATGGSYDTANLFGRGAVTLGPASLRLAFSHRQRGPADDESSAGIRAGRLRIDRVTLRSSVRLDPDSTFAFDAAFLSAGISGDAGAEPPLDRERLRNGYASLVWARSLSPSNQLSVRLDHWSSHATTRPADCDAAGGFDGIGPAGAAAAPWPDGGLAMEGHALLAGLAPAAKGCAEAVTITRRTQLELQDTLALGDQLRFVGGWRLRQEQARLDAKRPVDWSASVQRVFAGLDWRLGPVWAVNAGVSADDAASEVDGLSLRAGANWHPSDHQTVRLAWSSGNWASDAGPNLALAGNVLTHAQVRSADLGYLLQLPSSNAIVDARLFWTRFTGRAWNDKVAADQPTHGEIHGLELRASAEFGGRWAGFAALSTMTEGRSAASETQSSRPWPWSGAVGLTTQLGAGWRTSVAYYAASRLGSAQQSAGRLDLALVKDFELAGARARAALSMRRADHMRTVAADGVVGQDGVVNSVFVSLRVAY